uniref:Uncharacterized protein n=1 Tax=Acrobeloides nanus TaxID=290746 RepID=A0A914C7S9_9BILA
MFILSYLLLFASPFVAPQAIWNETSYPNVLEEQTQECKINGTQAPYLTCDPDEILTQTQRFELNDALKDLKNVTTSNGTECSNQGYIGVVLLARKIVNGTTKEAQKMANYFRDNWDFGRCDKGIIILMVTFYQQFYMACQPNVPLSDSDVNEIFEHNKDTLFNGNYFEGLSNVIKESKNKLTHQTGGTMTNRIIHVVRIAHRINRMAIPLTTML